MYITDTFSQQLKKSIIVEHFTNTRCVVCASRNPGFYSALSQNPDVLHIAYHPSSPYSTCLFSTQNKSENDARTKFYHVYGGTPTFVINGIQKSSSDVQNTSVYNSFSNQASPLSIVVKLESSGSDSLSVKVVIKAVAQHDLTNLSLYVPLVEDTVAYDAPNGEKEHYDVFRKSFSGTNSIPFTAPKLGSNDFVFNAKISKNQLWNQKKLKAIAIINSADLSVIQAAKSSLITEAISSIVTEELNSKFNITLFPNPKSQILHIVTEMPLIGSKYTLMNVLGLVLERGMISQKEMIIDVSHLSAGNYIVSIGDGKYYTTKTFSKID
jgi:hypothetical protein